MPSWLSTTLGRVYIAVSAVALALAGLSLAGPDRIEYLSLGVSLLRGSVAPLVTLGVVLECAARVTAAIALTAAVTISAARSRSPRASARPTRGWTRLDRCSG